jgi:hypothetical protein
LMRPADQVSSGRGRPGVKRRMDGRGGRDGRSGGSGSRNTGLLCGGGDGRGGSPDRAGALEREAAGFAGLAPRQQSKASLALSRRAGACHGRSRRSSHSHFLHLLTGLTFGVLLACASAGTETAPALAGAAGALRPGDMRLDPKVAGPGPGFRAGAVPVGRRVAEWVRRVWPVPLQHFVQNQMPMGDTNHQDAPTDLDSKQSETIGLLPIHGHRQRHHSPRRDQSGAHQWTAARPWGKTSA